MHKDGTTWVLDQHNFVPFIETGSRVNRAGTQFLDLLSGVKGVADVAPVLVDVGRRGSGLERSHIFANGPH